MEVGVRSFVGGLGVLELTNRDQGYYLFWAKCYFLNWAERGALGRDTHEGGVPSRVPSYPSTLLFSSFLLLPDLVLGFD